MELRQGNAQSRLESIQDVGWLLLVILVPLGVNLWGQRPFELPKVMWVRTIVWVLVSLLLTETILARQSLRRRFQTNPMLGSVGLLAVVIMVTTLTAVNPQLSLWGSIERNQGAVTLLTYLLLFLLAADQLRPLTRARQVLVAMVATAAPLILFSMAQVAGWNPFNLISDARSPIYATLGRANFVGAYLAILTPLTLALLLMAHSRKGRLSWAVLLAGELVVIGLTLTRSAWLATAVALSLFALLWWGAKLTQRWRRLAWGSIVSLFLSGPLVVLWLGQRQLGSTAARLSIWQGTVELIGKRPFLGYGADALGMMFPRVYPPELVYYQGREFFVDRAHNLLLDWGVIAGIPGLLAYSLILIMFVITIYNALNQPQLPQKRALLIGSLAAVLGNTVNNLVSFDVTPTATATWLLMGMGVALTTPSAIQVETVVNKRPLWQWLLSSLLFVGIGIAIWQVNGRPLIADIATRSARRYAQAENLAKSTIAAEQAVAYWPVEPTYHLFLSQSRYQQAVANPSAASTWLPQAEAALLTAQQHRPDDPIIWLQTAQFYTSASQQFGSNSSNLAHNAYQQAITLAPNQATIYVAWGRFYLEGGDAKTAASLLRQAVILDGSNGDAYIYLGAAELTLGRLEIALADYREAVRLLPKSGDAYAGLANSLWQLGQEQEAMLAIETALRHDPQNTQAIALHEVIINNSP